MKKRLWIATALIVGATPVWAQPDNIGAMAPSDSIAVAELEKAIGGRTTLELKFKDLTTEQVTEAVTKSSGLRFVAPSESPFSRVTIYPPVTATDQIEEPTWDGDVDKTDFWPALRKWGSDEKVRLTLARAALQESQKNEVALPHPKPAAGETEIAAGAVEEWQRKNTALSRRRMFQRLRLDPNYILSAGLAPRSGPWNLIPTGQLVSGYAFNSWPCLVLATQFQRAQKLLLQESATREKGVAKNEAKDVVGQKTLTIKLQDAIVGGHLTDSLSLDLLVYLEPKLLQRARMNVFVTEARDDANEDLILFPVTSTRGNGSEMPAVSYGRVDSGVLNEIPLRPRQSKGQRLAVLRGVVVIRYPMQAQEHEITNFEGPQNFLLNTEDLPIPAQFEPPHLENGSLQFSTSVKLESERGGRRLWNRMQASNDVIVSALGRYLLPSRYTFIDSQGRTWNGDAQIISVNVGGSDGSSVRVTSPPTPPPDNFTYSEKRSGYPQLVPQDPDTPNAHITLTPEELAKVRFTKATFTTEFNWRTLEVPFEFHDLPLPPR